ncbi:MAG: polysaccharide pyruvyl transferase family protein [Tahibacter sp.]
MTECFRLVVVADVGGDDRRHIGDEAMLEANVAAFRRHVPQVEFTVVSRDPAWVRARYGVEAIAPPQFPADSLARNGEAATLDDFLERCLHGGPGDDIAQAVSSADAVLISGGGNLSSSWPDLLIERVVVLQLADHYGKPSLVTGQTLGPRLQADQREVLGRALSLARFVGVREIPSATLALELGVDAERLWHQVDDAFFPDATPAMPSSTGSGATIVVTLDPQLRASDAGAFDAFANQLAEVALQVGAPLVLVPHVFGNEAANAPSDLTEARILAERLAPVRCHIAIGVDVKQARQIVLDAALVVSSRYHPIVFAVQAGIACIGIHGDEYCRIKLQGALLHARQERWSLTYAEVKNGGMTPLALTAWRLRAEFRERAAQRHSSWIEDHERRWVAMLRALDPQRFVEPIRDVTRLFGHPVDVAATALIAAMQCRRRAWELDHIEFENIRGRQEQAEQTVQKLDLELAPGRTIRRYAAELLRRLRGLR